MSNLKISKVRHVTNFARVWAQRTFHTALVIHQKFTALLQDATAEKGIKIWFKNNALQQQYLLNEVSRFKQSNSCYDHSMQTTQIHSYL